MRWNDLPPHLRRPIPLRPLDPLSDLDSRSPHRQEGPHQPSWCQVLAKHYARAGIVEYWVLDLTGSRLIVHRRPEAGTYQDVMAYAEQESAAPLPAPGAGLVVGSLL